MNKDWGNDENADQSQSEKIKELQEMISQKEK
jgi:hypothetical protein